MKSTKFRSLEELAAQVQSGDSVAFCGALFHRLPIALTKAVLQQKRDQLHYYGWSGGITLEILLGAKAIRKISFCFSSLDLFGLAPLFRKALEEETVEFEEWSSIALMTALRAAQSKLPSAVFRPAPGSDIYDRCPVVREWQEPFDGVKVGFARAVSIDVCLLHAARADEDGNVEILGAQHLDESFLGASKRRLVTVEEIVPRGELGKDAKGSLIWPRSLVDGIAVVPGGAYPSSSPGYYVSDYRNIQDGARQTPFVAEAPSPERLAFVRKAETITHRQASAPALRRHRKSSPITGPVRIEEIMIYWMASHFANESICSVGAVTPMAYTAYAMARKTHAPGLTILGVNAGCIDPLERSMVLYLGESLDTKGSAYWCGGDHAWYRFYLPQRVTHEVVSSAQIDQFGWSNTVEVKSATRKVRLPGQGGMAEVADIAQSLLFYLPRQSKRGLVERVDFRGVGRTFLNDEERDAANLPRGVVALITNLATFWVNPVTRRLELATLHPGVELSEVIENTGFPVTAPSEIPETPVPSAEWLVTLREDVDPLGLRFLETVTGAERNEILEKIMLAEEDFVAGV